MSCVRSDVVRGNRSGLGPGHQTARQEWLGQGEHTEGPLLQWATELAMSIPAASSEGSVVTQPSAAGGPALGARSTASWMGHLELCASVSL